MLRKNGTTTIPRHIQKALTLRIIPTVRRSCFG